MGRVFLSSGDDLSRIDEEIGRLKDGWVTGVKGSAETGDFRKGNVTVSAVNVGALPTTGGTVTGPVVFSHVGDSSPTTVGSPALIVGGTATTTHIEIDGNEIMAKTNGTTPSTLNINGDGGSIYMGPGGLTVAGTIKGNLTGNVTGNASSASTAAKLTTARALQVNLASTSAPTFDGSADVKTIGVTGTLPVAHGGTGVTTLVGNTGLIHAMFDTNLTDAGFVPVFTTSWADGGYMSVANLKTAMALNNVNNTADANKSVKTAGTLTTARALQVNLASASAPTFNGSADVKGIGVTGVLPIAHGGTGNTTGTVATASKVANALTFTGYQSKTFNGSTAVSVAIPNIKSFVVTGCSFTKSSTDQKKIDLDIDVSSIPTNFDTSVIGGFFFGQINNIYDVYVSFNNNTVSIKVIDRSSTTSKTAFHNKACTITHTTPSVGTARSIIITYTNSSDPYPTGVIIKGLGGIYFYS